ncbi:MAG: Transcriptional family [Devosia sp.]|jgi:DNA-binding transcriptional LysR family regulator|nr:Transcriptional family [Devosia sp.]
MRNQNLNQRQIETFYWAARLGSFASAAQHLNATQSAVSMRIQELEQRVGEPLFDRSQRVARLTAQGAALMPYAEEILIAADRFLEATKAGRGEVSGYVRLGVAEIVAMTWLPELIGRIRQDHPALQVEIEVALSHIIEEKLLKGSLDMAFAACEMPSSQFSSIEIEEVPFTWAKGPALQDVPEMLTPEALANLPIVATSREWQFRGSTLSWLTNNDVHFRNVTICNTFRTAGSLAKAGLGLAYLPTSLYGDAFGQGELVKVPCNPENAPLRIWSICPLSSTSLAIRVLETAAKKAAQHGNSHTTSGSELSHSLYETKPLT